jgi:uncharacterized protein (DUF58 family)
MMTAETKRSQQPGPQHEPAVEPGIGAGIHDLCALRAQAHGTDLGLTERVESLMAGPYLSPFRGRGMEFAEVRAFAPGDEVRHIDWRVTARTGKPHSKLYQEERERPVLVLVDGRTSMRFGTRVRFKSVAAARMAALLAWMGLERGDRVGGVTLTDSRCRALRLRRDRNGSMALMAAIANATTEPGENRQTTLADGLVRLREIACTGAQVFVFSDFADLDASARRHLGELARYTDTSCILVCDPLEMQAPSPGSYRVSDGADVIALRTGGDACRDAWGAHFELRRRNLERLCRVSRTRCGLLSTDRDISHGNAGSIVTGAVARGRHTVSPRAGGARQ